MYVCMFLGVFMYIHIQPPYPFILTRKTVWRRVEDGEISKEVNWTTVDWVESK
jgi:hypothetical protein